ncbi:MAG TPA: cation transporter [Stellaceae bacterium]|nr:cation transporter [Stellaceae bacterium]
MIELRVGGMTCGHCVAAVTRAVQRLDPAAAVSVDLATGRVSVAGALARAAVESAIEAAGYTVETSGR